MKLQHLVIFTHETRKLFFVSVMNDGPRFEYEATVDRNYQHAKALHKRLLNDEDASGLRSGFIFALINTDFSGWTNHIHNTAYETIAAASDARDNIIAAWSELGYEFVGSHRSFVKGIHGAGQGVPKNWAIKFNVDKMTKRQIDAKVEFIVASMDKNDVPKGVSNAAYLAVVAPHTDGPRMKNYGSYEVDSLSNLFRFVRNYIGKDLP